MAFEKPRILTDSEQTTIRGKMLAGHATPAEQLLLVGHMDLVDGKLRGALQTLSGCLPDRIFVYGPYGESWSDSEPEETDFEEINFEDLLA